MLSAVQGWWYESWSVSDWFGTVLNQPLEVHTLMLGAFAGILLGTVTARCRPEVASAFALGVILFALGALRVDFVCNEAYRGCRHIRLKPWYFLAGFLLTHVLTIGAVEPVSRNRVSRERRQSSSVHRLFGLLVIALVGIALYSFVSPEPVRRITGLSTVGGLVGSVLSFSVFYWMSSPERDAQGFSEAVQTVISRERSEIVHVLTFGTAFGFGFPRIVWEAGTMFGQQRVAVGPDSSLQSTLFAVGLYTLVIFLLSLALLRLSHRNREERLPGKELFVATALGNISYAGCLLVAVSLTGFA